MPPRTLFIDYPLGQTAGRAHHCTEQQMILNTALRALEEMNRSGDIWDLPLSWPEGPGWKENAMTQDDRLERHAFPQYQFSEDATVASPSCPTCRFLD